MSERDQMVERAAIGLRTARLAWVGGADDQWDRSLASAALAAVALDIADEVRRQCAEELRAAVGMTQSGLWALADRWSDPGRTSTDETERAHNPGGDTDR